MLDPAYPKGLHNLDTEDHLLQYKLVKLLNLEITTTMKTCQRISEKLEISPVNVVANVKCF